jgi:hypothetical protein
MGPSWQPLRIAARAELVSLLVLLTNGVRRWPVSRRAVVTAQTGIGQKTTVGLAT